MDIETKIKGPVQYTSSISTDGTAVPVLIKQEPNDVTDVSILTKEQSHRYVTAIPMPLTPEAGDGDSIEVSPTMKSKRVKCGLVPSTTPNLYEVKNEFPYDVHTEALYNSRLDVGSELVEIKGELDGKPEPVGNVKNAVVLSDDNIPSCVENNDTVNQISGTAKKTCGSAKEEDTAIGR